MKKVKILGAGCINCQTTKSLVEQVALEKGVDIEIEKVEDIQKIVAYGVMSTPAVVIDDAVVHAGGIPAREKVQSWF